MPNARFWEFINGDWVKLTLSPEKPLSWGYYSRTDEGYHAENHTWEMIDGGVLRTSETSGRDCDGRHGTDQRDFCSLENLRAIPALTWSSTQAYLSCGKRDVPYLDDRGQPLFRADWREFRPTQVYDQFAQAAGY